MFLIQLQILKFHPMIVDNLLLPFFSETFITQREIVRARREKEEEKDGERERDFLV